MKTPINTPRSTSWRRFARVADERGSALVEAALIIPLVLLLTFGSIEFGFAFNEQGTVRSTTRSAARAASTLPKATDAQFEGAAVNALTASVDNLANGVPDFALIYDAGDGSIKPTTPSACGGDCAYYDWNGTAFVHVGGHWSPANRDACPGQSERVGVFLKVHHDFLTGLFTDSGIDLSARTVMALEPFPSVNCGD